MGDCPDDGQNEGDRDERVTVLTFRSEHHESRSAWVRPLAEP